MNGTHYARTSEAWLSNMDRNKDEIMPILGQIYGEVCEFTRVFVSVYICYDSFDFDKLRARMSYLFFVRACASIPEYFVRACVCSVAFCLVVYFQVRLCGASVASATRNVVFGFCAAGRNVLSSVCYVHARHKHTETRSAKEPFTAVLK